MTIKESLKIERSKQPNEIVLIKENGWWRAYEESAYICRNFSKDIPEDEKLKPTHRYFNDIEEDVIFVGFPIKSMNKYLPAIDDKISYNDDMNIGIVDISSYEHDISDFENWKKSVSLKSKSSSTPNAIQQKKESCNQDRYIKITMLAQEILAYPLENKTMIENIMFISDLKKQIVKII